MGRMWRAADTRRPRTPSSGPGTTSPSPSGGQITCLSNPTLSTTLSFLYRGSALNQALKPPAGGQTPLVGGAQPRPDNTGNGGAWDQVLQSNRAGAATNAEDFTQEFMSQLMGNTAANLPPALVSNTVNGPPQHLQNNNLNQLNCQQDQAVRISTPTKQVSKKEWRQAETSGIFDVCVCCVVLFIYQVPFSVYTPSPYPQSYPTKPAIYAPAMSKLQTRKNPNSERFLTTCFLTLARPKARQIKCKVVSRRSLSLCCDFKIAHSV